MTRTYRNVIHRFTVNSTQLQINKCKLQNATEKRGINVLSQSDYLKHHMFSHS